MKPLSQFSEIRSLCDPRYRPGLWRPHLTVATAISSEQRQAALALAGRPIEPFKITFDRIDFVSWPPICVLKRTICQGPERCVTF
jgi:hypothetical protein